MAVFTRLSKAVSQIESHLPFAKDDHLGYVTSCPTNLGTAMRASVHIQLPLLGERKEEFYELAAKHHLQIRGVHGEHSETADHTYDISNKRRLGLTEIEILEGLSNGIKALIAREKELRPPKPHKA